MNRGSKGCECIASKMRLITNRVPSNLLDALRPELLSGALLMPEVEERDGKTQGVKPRQAKLDVGAAATLTTFLFETHTETKSLVISKRYRVARLAAAQAPFAGNENNPARKRQYD